MSLSDQSQQWLTARAKVSVQQARGLRIKGKLGTDGAHVLLQVGSQKFTTPKGQQQRADPVWDGQEAAFELAGFPENSAALRVQVLQRALVGPDKLLGQTDVDLGELYSNRGRDRTEWFKLFGKPGKPEKDRGEILLDIQFLKGSMSASMFDLSSQDKSRSKIGKLKDKLRGKKKEGLSDSASAIVPSVSQVMTDSEGEEEEEPVSGEKKKKNKLKSLFVPKSSLQRNTSQSMSTLSPFPERDSAIASSSSSGLNVESPEGKKKFKLFTHKRNSSTDSKVSQSGFVSKQSAPPMVCINGSHVYSEEPETKGSSLSLTSSGHGSGKVSSASKLEEPREEPSFEDMISTNPFELSFSEEPTSMNPFEEPTDSQPTASVRSARVSTVKPSASTSGTVSQLFVPNTNPFLDDDDSVDDSLENLSSVGRSTARKKRAPLPPQNKPEMSRPTIPSRDFLLEETKQFKKEVSKHPAPLPPGSLKKTAEEPVKESTVAFGHREQETLAVLENTQTSKVAPISKDELKAWCIQSMKARQGQNSSPEKINPNSHQATTGQTGQNESTKKQADTNPSTCGGGTVAARHKGPAPAKPSAASSRKSLSGDELSSHSTSLTGGTIHPEEKANVSANSESKDNPSKLTAVEGPKSLVAEGTKPELADKLSPKNKAAESLQNSYTDSLPRGEEIVEHLSKMNEPESLESETLTGIAKKKSRAPLPPAKPKRIGDPDSPNQQSSLSRTLQANLGHFPESQSNKKDEDQAQDTVSILYPSVTASSSTFAPLAEESEVMKACVPVSTGSGLRALPCARVVPTDAQSSAGEVKGAGGAPASVIRQQAVKPLNAADKQSDLRETNGKAAGATDSMQPKTEAAEAVGKGPYSQLTRPELISLVIRQQEQLTQRDSRIMELEQYIDNLLVRVMEEHPSILMSINPMKKAV
ncbi:hypothetical protein MHYP_G00187550 [Metynnis hypsauchen]